MKRLSRKKPKRVLRLPDLDHSRLAVLSTLGSSESQRAYRFAIDDFIAWHCSEPRLAFNKAFVLRYRLQIGARHLAPSTINVRLAAVRRTTTYLRPSKARSFEISGDFSFATSSFLPCIKSSSVTRCTIHGHS
jgi:hypothetical protein